MWFGVHYTGFVVYSRGTVVNCELYIGQNFGNCKVRGNSLTSCVLRAARKMPSGRKRGEYGDIKGCQYRDY